MTSARCLIAGGLGDEGALRVGVAFLSQAEQRAALQASGLKHASAYGLQPALCILAGRAALARSASKIAADRRALLTNGGPWAVDAALGFLRTARERGPQFVNPLVFPATLVSAGPTAAAAVLEARAAAIAVGHDELAFFEQLRRGRQLIDRGVADEVLVVAACGQSRELLEVLKIAERTLPLMDCALAFRLSAQPSGDVTLIDAIVAAESHPWPEVTSRFCSTVDVQGTIHADIPLPIDGASVLSAAGAVVCMAFIEYAGKRGTTRFVVACRKGGRTGAALFERAP